MAAYATQMDAAKQGILTPEMETVAKEEHLEPELIRQRVAKGTICIPANIHHKSLPLWHRRGTADENERESGHLRRLPRLHGRVRKGQAGNSVSVRSDHGLVQLRKDPYFPETADRNVAGNDRHRADV